MRLYDGIGLAALRQCFPGDWVDAPIPVLVGLRLKLKLALEFSSDVSEGDEDITI